MFRVMAFAVGAAAFGVAHVVIVAAWRTVFAVAGDDAPWFLNSGRAVAFTAACLFFAALIFTAVARARRDRWLLAAAHLAAGAMVAMAAVLAMIGPGTIFPVALAVGALIAAAACVGGGFIASRL